VASGIPEASDVDLTDLDRFAVGFPDQVFTRLRAEAPVWWHPPTPHTPDGVGFWVLSSYDAIMAAVSDATLFSSERAPGVAGGGTILEDLPYGYASGVLLNMMDDPRHHRIRRLVTPSFTPRALALMEEEIRTRSRVIVDGVADRGSCDFLSEVAVELPLQAVAALMGVPDADRADLMAWSNTTLDYQGRRWLRLRRRWRRTEAGSSRRRGAARVPTSSPRWRRPASRTGTDHSSHSPISSC